MNGPWPICRFVRPSATRASTSPLARSGRAMPPETAAPRARPTCRPARRAGGGDHDPLGPQGPCRAGQWRLSAGRQGLRPGVGGGTDARHDWHGEWTTPCSLPPHNSTGTNLVARGPLTNTIAWAKSAGTKVLTISLSRPPNRAGAAHPPRPRRRPGVACSFFPAYSIVGHRRHRPERHVGQPPAAQRCGHHRNTIGTLSAGQRASRPRLTNTYQHAD
jgi:hypothetical protein